MYLKHLTATLAGFLYVVACIATAPIDEVVPQPLAAPDYRLPLAIKPSAYNLTLRPYLLESDGDKRFTFDGEIFINITVISTTNTLVLHSKNLNYTVKEYWIATTPNAAKIQLPTPIADNVTDKLTFNLGSNLLANTNYTLNFKYVGSMEDDMYGFYRSSYTDQQNVTKWLGATQFETIRARRAFPSFDEPSFKATYDVQITRHKSMKSFSNTHIKDSVLKGDYYTDIYERTPPISSYLMAFLVSDFDERTDGVFSVVARPEYMNQTEYSFDVGKQLLNKFDKYLDLPYYDQGITTMHMAAIPDFAPGAMENWGLLKYKEEFLLFDPNSTSLKYKENIATIIAHEQAHMWFGDMVTCAWWSSTWLNEGFARYFEYHMAAKVEIEHHLEQKFVVEQLQTVMELDATNKTNPMTNEDASVESSPSSMFNSISYSKGGTVIRMIKHAMGEEDFQKSLQEYLKTYKYKNTVPKNLLDVWEKYGPAAWRTQASKVFKSFTEQVGYPVVNITVSNDGKNMTINQSRFLLKSDDGSNTTLLYTIPFTYTTNIEKDFNATSPSLYLEASNATKTIEFSQKVDWVIANLQETGYYRVNYDTKNWHSIHRALLSAKWGGIHELNRAQIVDDLFQLARAKYIDYDFAMPILEYLGATELNYLPWAAAFNGYKFLTTRLGLDTRNFGIYIRLQLENAYKQFGFDEKSSDTTLDIFTREQILSWSCKYGNENCINQAKSRFSNMQSKPVPVNIRTVVYCTAMREGTESDYNALLHKYKTETVPTEKSLILKALGCVKNQKLIEKHFNITMSADVRRHDKSAALTTLYSENNENVTPVFDLVTKNFKELADSMGSYSAVAGVISNIAARFTEKSQEEKLKKFNEDHGTEFGSSAGTLDAAEKIVAENLAWSNERLDTVKLYLEKRVKGGGNSINSFTILTIAMFTLLSTFCH